MLGLWSLSNHSCCQARILGVKSVQLSQFGLDIPQVNMGTSLPPLLFTNSAGSYSSPSLSILSTASCEPQRRRSVQDLPGIGTESSQVRNSQTLERAKVSERWQRVCEFHSLIHSFTFLVFGYIIKCGFKELFFACLFKPVYNFKTLLDIFGSCENNI